MRGGCRPLVFERSEFNGLAFFGYFLRQCQKVTRQRIKELALSNIAKNQRK